MFQIKPVAVLCAVAVMGLCIGCMPATGATTTGSQPATRSAPVVAPAWVPAPAQLPASTPAPATPADAPSTWAPASRTRASGCISQDGLPDPACTPGAVDPRVTQADIAVTICTRGYTATVRPRVSVTEKLKRDQMAAYGMRSQRMGDWELDHLIPLELGGAPLDAANLWPEAWSGANNAHMKDAVETYLKSAVCRGALPLVEAQRQIATNWVALYRTRGLTPAQ